MRPSSSDDPSTLLHEGLQGKHLVLGLTGGIACFKAAALAREFIRSGASVQVIMTEGAQQFITPLTMQALTGRPVLCSTWQSEQPNGMDHIDVTRQADAVVVAPASADFIAQLAQGLTPELLSLACLARPRQRCALLVAPAMNREMWSHPATQRNVAQIAADGAVILGPAHGEQACGEVGDGRMLEAAELSLAIEAYFQPKVLAGRRVLITAGPTFEAIDPVRGITNLSSGKMGFALARAACEAGAQVTLVAGPVVLPTPAGVTRIDVSSAMQMMEQVMALAPSHGLLVATAAVADWRPRSVAEHKIKKDGSGQAPALEFEENPDILARVAGLPAPERPFCVGFAAESENVQAHAEHKRLRKGVEVIVANHGPSTFGRDDNTLVLIDAHGSLPLGHGTKLHLARRLVGEIARRLPSAA